MECNKPYTITSINDLDIDDLSSAPDYFLGVRELEDESTGTKISTPVRVPGRKVMPNGSLVNVVALETNNSTLNVPEGQVRAGYIDVQPGGNVMRYADTLHKARFLMVSNYMDDKMLIQTSGFLTIPAGHRYLVNTQYYVSANGEPTTDSASGQKLFVPLNDYVLSINGDF